MSYIENTHPENGIIQTVIATEYDGRDETILVLNFLIPEKGFNLESAIKAAATDFCKTDEGKALFEGNCNWFNWGDVAVHLPAAFLEKHGVKMLTDNLVPDLLANFDQNLVDEDEISPEGDEENEG